MSAHRLAARANLLEAGQGPLLLCLHGIGSSAKSFSAQLTGLCDDFRVVARDAPGYAGSPDPEDPPGLDDYVDEAAALIERAGETAAFILGMSWGGVIAMQLSRRHPAMVRGLILGDSTRGSGQSEHQAAAMLARAAELGETGPAAFARRRVSRLLAPTATSEALAAAAEAMAGAIRLPGYDYAAQSMAATNLDGQLSSIGAPTLVIYGSEDVVTGKPESEAIAAQIAGSQLVVLPGAGHLANQEAPGEFNDRVRRFVAGL